MQRNKPANLAGMFNMCFTTTRTHRWVVALGTAVCLAGCTAPDNPDPGKGNDATCTVDADCSENQVCSDDGVCVNDPGNDNTNANDNGNTNDNANSNDNANDNGNDNSGDPDCLTDADCPSGEVCSDDGACVPESTPECVTDDDCTTGQVCTVVGTCAPEAGELPCASDADCGPGEVCAADGFCADDDGGSGGGGGGGGGAPQCTGNLDCAEGEVCSDGGICVPDDGDTNFAEVMAGCWELTFTLEDFDPEQAIYQFDSEGRLERTWGVQADGTIIEELRYTAPNALFWDALYTLVEQDVSVNAAQTSVVITVGLVSYSYNFFPACTVNRTVTCTEITQIQATLTGSPPDTLVDGALTGDSICESTGDPDPDIGIFDASVTGLRVDCPDPADDQVESQEERGNPCN